jgi:putative ABC transport system permease protein
MSRFGEYVKMAIQNIRANKGRSFLTMLGIIIGIASVIMIMAVGAGTTASMNSELEGIGGGQIYIYTSEDSTEFISEEDIEAMRKDIPAIEGLVVNNSAVGETVSGKGDFTLSLYGTTQDGLLLSNLEMKYGRFLQEVDVAEARNVCVISEEDAKRLFGSGDVVGMDVDVTSFGVAKSYRIIGVTAENESAIQFSYGEQPIYLDIPYTCMADYMENYNEFSGMNIKVNEELDQTLISKEVTDFLDRRHDTVGEDYFRVQSFQDQMSIINNSLNIMTAFVSCVAAISLLVGGIGVMNIMLVSVTERTREIGIRKSLGAKTTSITLQFLAESAILTILGGIIGIILGLLGAYGICSAISGSMNMDIKPGIQLSTIAMATFFSCMVGLFFGIYPARKAAKLSPIEALRRN